MSQAYTQLPDWAKPVLIALAARFNGRNNGDLSLTPKDAKELGVSPPWKLYAGVTLMRDTGLLILTRQGHLKAGKKVCNLYALTWKPIDEPPEHVAYDAGVKASPLAWHQWAKWEKPTNWAQRVKTVKNANHGVSKPSKRLAAAIPVSPTWGTDRSPTWGNGKAVSDHPPGGKESLLSDHPPGVSSKISGRGPRVEETLDAVA